jgi:hypothetical protein
MSVITPEGTLIIENSHLDVRGNVNAVALKLGTARLTPSYDLAAVTGVGNTTPYTVEFSNATTGLATTSNLQVGGTLKLGGTVDFENPLSLAAVSLVSNTTPYTIEFSNAATGIATTANVDVGGELTVSGNATVSSNLTVGGTSLVDLIYPIGAIYITTSAVSPSSIWAGTTWVAYGEGRTMIGHGAGAGLTDRPTVEATGGAETHTLTKAEIPPHVHTERHNTGGGLEYKPGYNAQQEPLDPPDTINIINTGDGSADGLQGQAHNNMQPYIVTYMWKRTA